MSSPNDSDQTGKIKLMPLDELTTGQPKRVRAGNRCILLCRVAQTVYAVNEMCTHEDISLSLGVLEDHYLRCPLHGSRFDIRNGKVIDEPAEIDLETHSVMVEDGWIYLIE